MNDMMTVTGIVGSDPEHIVTPSGVAITSFKLASRSRWFDRTSKAWVDGETNWYKVSAYRRLAFNLARSVHKGEHVLVTGRLEVRSWQKDDRRGTSVEIKADSVGHDLFWHTTDAVRSDPTKQAPAADATAPTPPADTAIGWAQPLVEARPEPRPLAADGFLPSAGDEMRELADVDS